MSVLRHVFIAATSRLCIAIPLLTVLAAGQVPKAAKALAEPGPAAPAAIADPLGRETPRKSFFGFLRTAQAGRFEQASYYLELTDAERKNRGSQLARDLLFILDTAYRGIPLHISDSPEGAVADAGTTFDLIGPIELPDRTFEFQMVRVNDPQHGRVWLVAAADVRKIPAISAQIGLPSFMEKMPDVLLRSHFASLALWQWLAGILLIPVAFVLGWGLMRLLFLGARSLLRRIDDQPVRRPGIVLVLIATIVIHALLFIQLGIPVLYRYRYGRMAIIAGLAGVLLIIARAVGWGTDVYRNRAARKGMRVPDSVIILGRRLLNVLLIVILVLTVLSSFGVDTTTFLAGVGIGGIAIALAAQKTLENVIGGITVMSDEVVRVGDFCKFGDMAGTLEDVSLRSTRVRTVNDSVVAIPNGALAGMTIENMTRRGKILFTTRLGFPYEIGSAKLQEVLAALRALVDTHSLIEVGSSRVRFVAFGDSALIVEIFCYVLTTDMPEFLHIQEELLFQIFQAADRCGVGFAYPTRTVHFQGAPAGTAPSQLAENAGG